MKRLSGILLALVCWAAIAAMAYGQYEIRLDPNNDFATMVFLAAALAAAVLLRVQEPWPAIEAGPFEGGRRWPAWVGVPLILLGIAAVGAGSYLLTINFQVWVNKGWLLIIAGTSLASLGFYGLDPKGKSLPGWSRAEIVALLAIFALGTVLRFYRYTDFPGAYTMHAIEEPQTGMRANFMLHGVYYWEFLFDNYITAASIWFFGDRTINIIRIPYTIVSAITVFPLYLLLRQIVSKPAALAGTFLWAVSSWNIIYSRCAHAIFPTNLLVIAAFALLLRTCRSHRLASMPWAALLSAYCLYAYAAYRGTPLVVLLVLGAISLNDLLSRRRATDEQDRTRLKSFFRRDVIAVVLQLAMMVAMAAPIYRQVAYNAAQPGYYFEAANRSLSNKDYYSSDPQRFIEQRIRRIRETARIFMHKGDGADTFNEPGEPMLDPLTSVAFVGGIFLCLVFPRRPYHAWVLFMFLFVMVGGTVFVQNLDVRRLQGVTPFVAALAAIFIDRTVSLGRRLPRVMFYGLGVPALIVGAAFSTWWGYNVYFNKMANNRFVQQALHASRYLAIVHYGRTVGAGHYTLLLSDIRHFFSPSDFYWLIGDLIPGEVVADLTEILPPKQLPVKALPLSVVLQEPYERKETARLLQAVYPGTQCADFIEAANPYITLIACNLPTVRKPVSLSMRLTARYFHGREPTGDPIVERPEPLIGFGTYPPQCYYVQDPRVPCSVEWSGTMVVPASRTYHFALQTRGGAALDVKIDGKPFRETVELAAGEHHVTAFAVIPRDSDTGVRLAWETAEGWEAVPFYDVSPDPSSVP